MSLPGRNLRGSLHQVDKQFVKPGQIEISLHVNQLKIERRLVGGSPGKSVSVKWPSRKVDVEVKLLFLRDNYRI